MIPLNVFGSGSVAADLLQHVRWSNGVSWPRCRFGRTDRNDSYEEFQRHLCKDYSYTFKDNTGMIFAHSKNALRRWLSSMYGFLRLKPSFQELQWRIEVTHKTIHRRTGRFASGLDMTSFNLIDPVEIDEVYISDGKKGRGHDFVAFALPVHV